MSEKSVNSKSKTIKGIQGHGSAETGKPELEITFDKERYEQFKLLTDEEKVEAAKDYINGCFAKYKEKNRRFWEGSQWEETRIDTKLEEQLAVVDPDISWAIINSGLINEDDFAGFSSYGHKDGICEIGVIQHYLSAETVNDYVDEDTVQFVLDHMRCPSSRKDLDVEFKGAKYSAEEQVYTNLQKVIDRFIEVDEYEYRIKRKSQDRHNKDPNYVSGKLYPNELKDIIKKYEPLHAAEAKFWNQLHDYRRTIEA